MSTTPTLRDAERVVDLLWHALVDLVESTRGTMPKHLFIQCSEATGEAKKLRTALTQGAGGSISSHIKQPYALAEIRAKIASHDYSAELLLQHAMLLLEGAGAVEPVATIYTMEALVPGGSVKHHATVHKAVPAGTKLYAAMPATQLQQAVARERESILDEWSDRMQSDLEHGVRLLNERAAAEFTERYPQLAGFAAAIRAKGTHQ